MYHLILQFPLINSPPKDKIFIYYKIFRSFILKLDLFFQSVRLKLKFKKKFVSCILYFDVYFLYLLQC